MHEDAVQRTVLPDGLTVLSQRMPAVRSVAVGIWVRAGSSCENHDEHGLAHLLEHMVFKGTTRRSARQIATRLEAVGGHVDAFTGRELSCYYAVAMDRHLPRAVELLADVLIHFRFTEEQLESEKRVVREEIRNVNDTPDDVAMDMFTELLWKGHPLGRPIMGTEPSVAGLRADQLHAFWRTWYTADRIIAACAGNVDHERFAKLCTQHLSFPRGDGGSPTSLRLPRHRPRVSVIDRDISQLHLCLGRTCPGYRHPDRLPLLALNAMLGGGMSSRLFQEAREKRGLAYAVFSTVTHLSASGLFVTYLATDPQNAALSLRVVRRELRRLVDTGLTPSEVRCARNQLKGGVVLAHERSSNRMTRLAIQEIYLASHPTLEDTLGAIDSITEERVHHVARKYLAQDRLSLLVLGPKSSLT
jgi:predicted Zn-dependent peptidase